MLNGTNIPQAVVASQNLEVYLIIYKLALVSPLEKT